MRTKREQIKSKVTHYRTVLQKYKRLFPTCADRMWAIRKSMDMNQAEFGEHVGLTSSCICSIECGYHLPRGITLTVDPSTFVVWRRDYYEDWFAFWGFPGGCI